MTQNLTEAAGLPAYETSNHAKPGQQSQHNLAYWRGEPYVGIGPGAHGRLPGPVIGSAFAHQQIKRPEDWLAGVNGSGYGLETLEDIDPDERAIETIMMGLRLKEGISVPAFGTRFSRGIHHYLDNEAIAGLMADGYAKMDEKTMALTAKGAPLMNFLLAKMIK